MREHTHRKNKTVWEYKYVIYRKGVKNSDFKNMLKMEMCLCFCLITADLLILPKLTRLSALKAQSLSIFKYMVSGMSMNTDNSALFLA